MSHTVSITSI